MGKLNCHQPDVGFPKFRQNGKFDREIAAKGGLEEHKTPVLIGSRGGGQLFDGVIDEVAIFNVALSADDIKDLITGCRNLQAVSTKGKLTTVWGSIKTQ